MKLATEILQSRRWLVVFGWLLACHIAIAAQPSSNPNQERINERVSAIIDHALQQGTVILPGGVRATSMRIDISLPETREIEKYGEQAIAPLSKYLHGPDYRGQLLAVNLLGAIGKKEVLKPLTYAVEHCGSASARMAAVANLDMQPWEAVHDVMQRVAQSDSDANVRRAAQRVIDEHQATQK
jgi:HEAT repeat protein